MRHATLRPPSAAHRWLNCPNSVNLVQAYPNLPSDASLKGDEAHRLLEEAITWGVTPNHADVDIMYSVMFALEWILETYKSYGKSCKMYGEQELDIPQTGEFGTSDLIFDTPDLLHVIDYKNGYVPVEVKMNPQLMLYLLGAIAKYGTRKRYKLTIIQPNYVHRDGMIRHFDVTEDNIEWFEIEVASAMRSESTIAGPHCRTSYCPHRGSCETFLAWSVENLQLAWFPGEMNGMSDEQLAEALDQADILQGYRDQLRGEAMRRMLHQNRTIQGYKIVKARKDRDYADDAAREAIFAALEQEGVPRDALYDRTPVSIAGVERIIKGMYKPQGRNAWRDAMDRIVPPKYLVPQNQQLTLEKAIDGRKAYTRGSEFGALKFPTEDATSNTSNTSLQDIL